MKIKEKLKDLKEEIEDIWYVIKTPYFYLKRLKNKIKFFKKIWSSYFAAWDVCETIFEFNMELFCDFYENGEMEIIEWNSDKYHKNAKKWFDKIYKYWKFEREKLVEESENILDEWSEKTPMKFVDCEFENLKEIEFDKQEDSDELLKQYNELEQKINKLDKKYLKKIVELKDFMWT